MKRHLLPAALSVVLVLFGSVLAPTPVQAAADPAFGAADLPAASEVARIYPQYDGGSASRSTRSSLRALLAFGPSCGGLQEVSRSDRAIAGFYLTEAGESGRDEGTAPYVLLQDYRSASRARAALADARKRTLACRGTHPLGSASHRVEIKPLAGFAGQQRVAWIDTVTTDEGARSAVLITYLRQGRFLVGGIFTQTTGTPKVAPAELMLSLAIESLGSRRGPG